MRKVNSDIVILSLIDDSCSRKMQMTRPVHQSKAHQVALEPRRRTIVERIRTSRRIMQREFPLAPLVGVGAVVVHEGRVLLVQRGTEPMKGHWSLPGGLIELGELLTAAVVREVMEETGLLVEPIELVELLDRVHREADLVRYHYVIADYLCRVVGGSLLAASDAAAVCWVDPAEWRALHLDPVTVRVIESGWQRAMAMQPKARESR
jgi:8-oxo-dGTP diphosphatase